MKSEMDEILGSTPVEIDETRFQQAPP